MSSVNDLLKALSEEGAGKDEGQFSIDPEKGRDKLRSFQQAIPSYALLRMIQGLNQAKATRIELSLSRRETVLRAFGVVADLAEVQAAFRGEASLGRSWAGSLAAGLNAACLDTNAEIEVSLGQSWWDPRSGATQIQEPAGFRFRSHATRGEGLRGVWKRATIQREVSTRCQFSPCSFLLDGRTLAPDWEAYRDDEGTPVLISPQIEYLEEGDGFHFVLGDLSPYRREDDVLIWDREEARSLESYRLQFFPTLLYAGIGPDDSRVKACRTVISRFDGWKPKPPLIHLIRHGVIGETLIEPECLPNSMLLIDVSELPHDLSGLRPIRGEAFDQRMVEVQQLSVRTAQLALAHTDPAIRKHITGAIPAHLARNESLLGRGVRSIASWFLRRFSSGERADTYVAKVNHSLVEWLEKHQR